MCDSRKPKGLIGEWPALYVIGIGQWEKKKGTR